jgi:hypothetical protein
MDTTVLAPEPSPWFIIDSLGENSLFLGLNYPMMVKGNPAADGTTLPFMRNNCIFTSGIDIANVHEAGYHNLCPPDIGCFILVGESSVGFRVHNSWRSQDSLFWLKASVSNAEDWLT